MWLGPYLDRVSGLGQLAAQTSELSSRLRCAIVRGLRSALRRRQPLSLIAELRRMVRARGRQLDFLALLLSQLYCECILRRSRGTCLHQTASGERHPQSTRPFGSGPQWYVWSQRIRLTHNLVAVCAPWQR